MVNVVNFTLDVSSHTYTKRLEEEGKAVEAVLLTINTWVMGSSGF